MRASGSASARLVKLAEIIVMADKQFYVYILASRRNGTIYVGMTSALMQRVWQHKNNLVEGFTSKYKVDQLVYYEMIEDPNVAVQRERQLKKWNRKWKLQLIEKMNPTWRDLYDDITL